MKIGSLFKNQEMTWKKVIILAVASAVLTAVLKLIPPLEDTSFQDIAINLECWILFAIHGTRDEESGRLFGGYFLCLAIQAVKKLRVKSL